MTGAIGSSRTGASEARGKMKVPGTSRVPKGPIVTGHSSRAKSITASSKNGSEEDIKNTGKETFEKYLDTKKLSITLISSMIGLPFETTRRQVKAKEASGLIEHSESYGLLINKNSEFHKKISTEIVRFEQEQVVKLIEKVMG